jgi:C1A family cysteine protease
MLSKLGRAYPIKPNPNRVIHPRVSVALSATSAALPSQGSLSNYLGPIRDQGSLGSCSSHAWTGLRELLYNEHFNLEKDQTVPVGQFNLSPLYHYYKERIQERTYPADAGAQLSTGAVVLEQSGCCLESQDTYNVSGFNHPPTPQQDAGAAVYQTQGNLLSIETIDDIKLSISLGYPVVLGMTVYESFESDYTAKTGDMLMPNTSTEQVLGGHAILCFGYDDVKMKLSIRNSWGSNWGDNGNFYMGYKIFQAPGMIIDAYTFHPFYLTPPAPAAEPEPEIHEHIEQTEPSEPEHTE